MPSNISNSEIREFLEAIEFKYNQNLNKFTLVYDHQYIDYVSLSAQLAYLLGFSNPDHIQNGEIAKYSADMKGGINSSTTMIALVFKKVINF